MRFQDLARLALDERSDYIRTAAAESGLSELIVEKDFWVVWLLEQLFALSPTVGPFTFKGGTSLSKGYSAIQRFSEDIDISISRATLGFSNEEYFYEAPSAKETKRRVEQIRDAVRQYAVKSLLQALRDQLRRLSTRMGHFVRKFCVTGAFTPLEVHRSCSLAVD